MSARATFLAEQASAAYDDAVAAVSGDGWEEVPSGADDPLAVVLAEVRSYHTVRRWLGLRTVCPHVSGDAPMPLVWLGHAPGVIRCRSCAASVPPASVCDGCGARGALAQRVVVVPHRLASPISLTYHLCESCEEREAAT